MKTFSKWEGIDTSFSHTVQSHCTRLPSLRLLSSLPRVPEFPTRVKVLEFREDGIEAVNIESLEELRDYWDHIKYSSALHQIPEHGDFKEINYDHNTSTTSKFLACGRDKVKGRTYLVEDISLPYISALGEKFEVDPLFFVSYLKLDLDRNQNFLSGYHTMRRLPSLISTPRATTPATGEFSTLVYHEIRHFESGAPRREEYEILTRANVSRLVTTVDHHCDELIGCVRRNLGVWSHSPFPSKNPPENEERSGEDTEHRVKERKVLGQESKENELELSEVEDQAWTTIILVDPPMTSNLQIRLWGHHTEKPWTHISCLNTAYLDGYLDFSPWPPPSPARQEKSTARLPAQQSMLDDIVYHWLRSSPSRTTKSRSRNYDDFHLALTSPQHTHVFALRILTSHWNLQLEYLVGVVSDLEKGLLHFEQMDAHPGEETIYDEITVLRILLSDVNSWRRRVYFYLEQLLCNLEQLGEGQSEMMVKGDLQSVKTHLLLLRERLQSLLPVVMGAFSLLEAQRSVLKADLTIRLSGVALVFVPLSFTASLLSMSDDFMPGRRFFWVFFVVSVILIVILFWWAFWAQLGRFRRWGAGVMKSNKKKEKSAEPEHDEKYE